VSEESRLRCRGCAFLIGTGAGARIGGWASGEGPGPVSRSLSKTLSWKREFENLASLEILEPWIGGCVPHRWRRLQVQRRCRQRYQRRQHRQHRQKEQAWRNKASGEHTGGGRVNEGVTLQAERLLGGGPDGDSTTIH